MLLSRCDNKIARASFCYEFIVKIMVDMSFHENSNVFIAIFWNFKKWNLKYEYIFLDIFLFSILCTNFFLDQEFNNSHESPISDSNDIFIQRNPSIPIILFY